MADFFPLDAAHQTLLATSPYQGPMLDAVSAADIPNTYSTPLGGFLATDVAGAQAIIDNDANWLPFAKVDKLAALEVKYESIIAAGRIIPTKTYRLEGEQFFRFQMFWNNNQWPLVWPTQDDSTISLNQNEFRTKAQNILQYMRALWANQLAKKLDIIGAANAAALTAININTGWPSNP